MQILLLDFLLPYRYSNYYIMILYYASQYVLNTTNNNLLIG